MGSEGGKARKEKLSPEQRKKIASDAAKQRWANKKKQADTPAPVEAAPEPAPATPAPKKVRKTIPKEFGKAHTYAEKRLATALRERAEAMQRVAMLNVEIPSLVQVIKALGGTVNSQALQGPMETFRTPDGAAYRSNIGPVEIAGAAVPPIPVAQGAALGPVPDEPQGDDDIFLKQAEADMAKQGWV